MQRRPCEYITYWQKVPEMQPRSPQMGMLTQEDQLQVQPTGKNYTILAEDAPRYSHPSAPIAHHAETTCPADRSPNREQHHSGIPTLMQQANSMSCLCLMCLDTDFPSVQYNGPWSYSEVYPWFVLRIELALIKAGNPAYSVL